MECTCCAVERKQATVIFQQDDALLGDLPCGVESGLNVDYAFLNRVIDDSGGEFRTQNAAHVVVKFCHRNSYPLAPLFSVLLRSRSPRGSSLSSPAADAFTLL